MDRNQKFLKRLSTKEFSAVMSVLEKIEDRDFSKLALKKLSGHKDIYRVRVGTVRIILFYNDSKAEVLEIGRRNENTYKNF